MSAPLLNQFASLTRLRLSLVVSLSTVMSYLLFRGKMEVGIIWPLLGVLLLAAGLSVLNQVQEAQTDAKMKRTKRRPVASGTLDKGWALFISLLLSTLGLAALASAPRNPLICLWFGLAAPLLYNLAFTPLKRRTTWSLVPGALVGTIPPAIGWCAAGGSWQDPGLWLIAVYFATWQVPHFWLAGMVWQKEYRKAKIPVMLDVLPGPAIYRLTFLWTAAAVLLSLYLTIYLSYQPIWILAVLLAGAWLLWRSRLLLAELVATTAFRPAFDRLNAFNLIIILSGAATSLL
jgi:protoheme IX farnesyltransferase